MMFYSMDANNRDYNEACVKMAIALTKENIEFSFLGEKMGGGGYFKFPQFPKADVTCHSGTYGAEIGLFESAGFPWDFRDGEADVTGWLDVEDFIEKLKEALDNLK